MSWEFEQISATWKLRILSIILILVLGAIGVNNPILEKFDLAKEEGKDISLTFVKIVSVENNRYTVQTDLTGEQMVVVSEGVFNIGETISFYGTVREGMLYANKYHVHSFPKASYFLSILGLMLFLFLFFREWKFEKFMFIRRS